MLTFGLCQLAYRQAHLDTRARTHTHKCALDCVSQVEHGGTLAADCSSEDLSSVLHTYKAGTFFTRSFGRPWENRIKAKSILHKGPPGLFLLKTNATQGACLGSSWGWGGWW